MGFLMMSNSNHKGEKLMLHNTHIPTRIHCHETMRQDQEIQYAYNAILA
jgi:hypothetical protein